MPVGSARRQYLRRKMNLPVSQVTGRFVQTAERVEVNIYQDRARAQADDGTGGGENE